MENFKFYAPTEVVFGKDVENQTGEIACKYGRKALLVYGKGSVIKSGLLGRVEKALSDSGIEYREFGGAKPNPTLEHAKEGIKEAIAFGADMIIGIGGGSAIDTAKAIAHGTANSDQDLWAIWTRKVPLTKSLPVGAVLTIAAAGSEMSDSAVLTNEELGKKAGINTDFNRCRFAIVNPVLGMTLPKNQLAAGVTDIMMHTMERYFIPESNCNMTDEIAEGLLRTVITNGKRIIDDPSDYDAMCEVFWASSLSHNNLTECGRGKDFSVHKLGHALSARYDVTHGDSLSAVWGAWAKELYSGAVPRFARFAEKVWGITESDAEKAALMGIEKTVDFFKSIGMPVSLRDLGIDPSDEDLEALSLDATMQGAVKLSRIRPLDASDVKKIYRAALQ
ncbi:iron-containing alcohol dehydrogenase [Butyrivibrio proteoclasticus]|uniref:iron-containing alcohol dehydrogenase n=1 Tax=Butyrivibrio proteoclasticus TaxID=43305 RepID=UPI00047A19BE|nr:iron-containing alcohol dehydrogenase [Butyrivibrio proteoclasticus]